jgi:hypothetical protein
LNAEDHLAERVAHARPAKKIDDGEEISAKCEARDEAARQLPGAPARYHGGSGKLWNASPAPTQHVRNPVVAAPGLVTADLNRFGIGNMVTNRSDAPQSGWPRLWVIPAWPRWRKSAGPFLCAPGLCGFTSG